MILSLITFAAGCLLGSSAVALKNKFKNTTASEIETDAKSDIDSVKDKFEKEISEIKSVISEILSHSESKVENPSTDSTTETK